MNHRNTIAEPIVTIEMLPQTPEAYIRNQLENILSFANAIICWEEGAHTSSNWRRLLELCNEADYYRTPTGRDDDLSEVLDFIRVARAELSFWLRRNDL